VTEPQYSITAALASETDPRVYAIAGALNDLNNIGDADDIARYFEAAGIKGRVCISNACPVAIYVRQTTGNAINITGEMWTLDDGGWTRYSIPVNVSSFVNNFDDGQFANLDTTPHEPDVEATI
jgi:hypothetical protein